MKSKEENIFQDITLSNASFEPFYVFIKFQSKPILEDLMKGHLYMKNLGHFVKLEREAKNKGQGDSTEARLFNCRSLNFAPKNGTGPTFTFNNVDVSDAVALKKPVFCLTAYNITQHLTKFKYPNFEADFHINQQLYNDFKSEGEDLYALIISSGEFIDRVHKALAQKGLSFEEGLVDYKDTKIFEFDSKTQQVFFNSPFNKPECFKHQDEFRILINTEIDNTIEDGHFDLNIGDISDIATLFPAKKLLDTSLVMSGTAVGLHRVD